MRIFNLTKNFFNSLKKNSFVKNVLTVGSGNAISQAILILTAPILTRIFSPNDFGVLAIYSASAAILAKLFTLQYDMAIVLPIDDCKAKQLFKLSVKLSICFCVLGIGIASLVFIFPILTFFGLAEIPNFVPIVSVVGAFILTLKNSFNYINVRFRHFRIISVAVVISAIVSQSYIIAGGTLINGALILISGALLATFTDIFVQVIYGEQGSLLKNVIGFKLTSKRSKNLIYEYIDFPKYRMGQSLLNLAGQRVPEILLVSFFVPAIAGFYTLANKVIQQPGFLVTQAVSKVFFKDAAELRNRGTGLFRSMLKKTIWLAALGIIPFGLLILFSPSIFSFVFGDEWYTAGVYASYISIWMYTSFCNTPSTSVMPVLRQQKRYLISNGFQFLFRILAIVIGAHIGGALEAVICLTVVGVAYNIFIIIDVHVLAYKDEIN